MIFLAVAAPTPGRASRSFWDAVLRSTAPPLEAVLFDAEEPEADAAGADEDDGDEERAPDTVTRGEIFWIVEAETPAFERSATDEYGRPAMIFFAVAAPTPGRSSSSFWVAPFKSTRPPAADVPDAAELDPLEDAAELPAAGTGEELPADAGAFPAGAALAEPRPALTRPEIFSIDEADTPARERSLTDEYGRPAMIFFAVASPTPGRASRSCWRRC